MIAILRINRLNLQQPTGLLDSESRSYWQSSPRATALDASLEVIDELNHQIDSLSTENTTLNTLYGLLTVLMCIYYCLLV